MGVGGLVAISCVERSVAARPGPPVTLRALLGEMPGQRPIDIGKRNGCLPIHGFSVQVTLGALLKEAIMAKQVEAAKVVEFSERKSGTAKAINLLSDFDINQNKGMVGAWRAAVAACKAGEFLASTAHATALLEAKNERVMAYRTKHHDVRSVAPVNKQRANEVVSILKLSTLACSDKLFASLDGYDLGQNDLIALSRQIRNEWKWSDKAKAPPKTPAQLLGFVRSVREKKHATGNGNGKGKRKSTKAKVITAGNAVSNVVDLHRILKGLMRAFEDDAKVERVVNAMIANVDTLKDAAKEFAKA